MSVTVLPTDSVDSIKKKLKVTEAITCHEYLYAGGWLESTNMAEFTAPSQAWVNMKEGSLTITSVLEAMTADHLTHTVALCLANKLDKIVDKKMTALTELLTKADQQIQDTVEEACDELQHATTLINKATASVPGAPSGNPPEAQEVNVCTYAAAIHSQLPIGHQTTLARHAMRERQLLIEQNGEGAKPLQEWGEAGLVERANEALKFVVAEDKPEGTSFTSTRLLKNGGAILEADNADLITWLHNEDHRLNFQQCFDGGYSQVKDQECAVIAEYVPITHQVDNQIERRQIEHQTNIETDEIINTRWVKPEEH